MAQLQVEMREKEDPVTIVQSCLSFLKENILKDQHLVDYLSACSFLSEEDKQDIRDRKNLLRTGGIVKSILQHGNEECAQLLGVIEKSSLNEDFQNYLMTKKGDKDSGKWNLTPENYINHRETLIQEIEPSWIADIFLEESAITIAEHDELENAGTRKERCQKLLSLVDTKNVDLKMLTHALEKCRCISLLDVVTGKVPVISEDSGVTGIVKRNFRLLRQIIYDYLMMKTPWKKPIPESLLVHPAECKALLEYVRERNISLFEQVMQGSQKESKEGKNPTKITLGGKNFQHDFKILMKDVEPVPLGDMFLEKDIYSREDYVRLQGLSTRKEQASSIIHFMFRQEKPGPIGDCLYQLNWLSLIDKLKKTENENEKAYEDNKKKVKADEEGSIDLKTEEVKRTAEELPSSLDLKISSTVPIEEGKQREIIEALKSDTSLRKKIVELTHMNIQKAEYPLQLHLTSLTDEAVPRLVADNGLLISKMVTFLLELMNFSKALLEAKTSEINVTITPPAEKSRKKDISDVHSVKVKILQNWDLLVSELEPYQMLACFVSEGLLTEKDRQQILSFKSRHDRVVSLLQILLGSVDASLLNCFVQLLQLLNKNSAETFDSKDANTLHQEAEMARKYILLHFGEAVKEIDSYIMKDTLHKYGGSIPESISLKTKLDRKGRAYDFLLFVFENDGLVLELKNALKCRGFGHFFEEVFADTDETPQDKNQEHVEKKPKVHSLLSCKYSATLKEEYMERLEMYKLMEEECYPPFRHRDLRRKMFEREEMYMRMHRRFRDKERHPEEKVSVPVPDYELGVCQVVFAIDLGTSYSGYAFSMTDSPLDITAGKWKTQSSELLESPKTPTSLLLTSSDKFEAFGYEAEKRFKELVEENKHMDYRFFSHLKMELHKKKPLGTPVKVYDHMSRPMDALTVFSMTIEHLNKMCLEAVKEKNIPKGAMRWVLTIPSMWDNFAQQFMRKAAAKAGIPGPLLSLAFEPETATIYNIKGSRTDLTSDSKQQYKTGSQILLADLGGGVADFSLIGVKDEEGNLAVLHQSLGGEWGGNSINTSVLKIMEELLGAKVMEEFRKQTSDFLEMESNIELKKRDLSAENKLILTMYPSLAMICKEQTGKTYKQLVEGSQLADQVKVRTGKIILEPEMINKVFERTLTQSFTVMDKLLAIGRKVQDIILVGGFADSGIIQKKFQEKYSGNIRVIIPTDPGLAVLKGAVIFGHNQNIIQSRICPHTYGVKVLRYGFPTNTEDRKKVISGMTFGPGGFKTIITKGKAIAVDKSIDVDFVSPSNFARHLFLKFYQTDEPDMEGVSEEECIGRVIMTLSEPPRRIPTFMRLYFKFGGIEMAVNGNFKKGWLQVPSEMNFLDSIPSAVGGNVF